MLLRRLLIWRLRRALVGGLGGLGHRVLCRTLRGVTLRAVVELAVVELVVALLTLGRGGALALLLIRIGCGRTRAATAAALHRRTLLHVRLLRMLRALLALGVLSLRRLILRGLIRIPTLRALALLRGRTVALRGTLLIRRGRRRPPLLLRRELLALRRALLLGLLLRLRGTLILILVPTLVLRRALLLVLLARGLLIGLLIGRRRGLLILLLGFALRRAIHGRLRSRRLLLGSARRRSGGGRRGRGRAGASARGARREFLGWDDGELATGVCLQILAEEPGLVTVHALAFASDRVGRRDLRQRLGTPADEIQWWTRLVDVRDLAGPAGQRNVREIGIEDTSEDAHAIADGVARPVPRGDESLRWDIFLGHRYSLTRGAAWNRHPLARSRNSIRDAL